MTTVFNKTIAGTCISVTGAINGVFNGWSWEAYISIMQQRTPTASHATRLLPALSRTISHYINYMLSARLNTSNVNIAATVHAVKWPPSGARHKCLSFAADILSLGHRVQHAVFLHG